MPLPLDKDTGSDQSSGSGRSETNEKGPEPCPDLAPHVMMPELETLLSAYEDGGDGDVEGVACTLSFGREEEKGDWLSFVVCSPEGGEIASLTLPAAT